MQIFTEEIISFLYCIMKSVKILFLSFCMDQICVMYEKYIWESSHFIYEKWKIGRYDILFCKFELIK